MSKPRLLAGDCFKLLPTLEAASIDLIVVDPPYGTTNCKWDSVLDLPRMWSEIWRVLKPSGAVVIFGSEPFSSVLRTSAIDQFRYDLIWQKTLPVGFLNAKRMPLRAHENISVFYRQLPTYNPQKTSGHELKTATRSTTTEIYGKATKTVSYSSTERYPISVLKFGTDKHKRPLHPTQKPVALLRYLIRTFSNPGEVVLDFTMGSGSTGVAALLEQRAFIGMELESKYFKIARQRIKKFTDEA